MFVRLASSTLENPVMPAPTVADLHPEGPQDLDALVEGFLEQDRAATEALLTYLAQKYEPALSKRFGRSPLAHKLQDVLHNGLVKILKNSKQYDPDRGRFDVWAYRVVLNCARDAYRASKREAGQRPLAGQDLPSPVEREPMADDAKLRDLETVIRGLPQVDREMFQFFAEYGGEDWVKAYAERTGLKRGTISARFSRGLKKVRSAMMDQGWTITEDDFTRGKQPRTWLEGVGEMLWVDETYRLGVDFVEASPGNSLPSGRDRRSVDLTVEISGEGVAAEPTSHRLRLPAEGNSEPVYFELKPIRGGRFSLNLSVFTLREQKLLQKVKVALPPVKYRIGPSMP